MRNCTAAELEIKWPKLTSANYKKTSEATARYNCLAFANDNERKWWEAGLHGGLYYWPESVPDTLEGWVRLFEVQGYECTTNRAIEPRFEKVAIYVDLKDLLPGHVAKSDGKVWKSKLGKYQDIQHSTLDVLEGDRECEYGIVERILRRRIKKPGTRKKSK